MVWKVKIVAPSASEGNQMRVASRKAQFLCWEAQWPIPESEMPSPHPQSMDPSTVKPRQTRFSGKTSLMRASHHAKNLSQSVANAQHFHGTVMVSLSPSKEPLVPAG